MSAEELAGRILRAQNDASLRLALAKSVSGSTEATKEVLERYPQLAQLAKHVQDVKEGVLNNLEHYVNQAIESINSTGAHAYFARDRDSLLKFLDDIIGDGGKLIVKAKSMVTEEIRLSEYLTGRGHVVYETDLGALLVQIAGDKPMHTIAPAVHISRERAGLLLERLGIPVKREAKHEEIVAEVRRFLREKFLVADIGITGANAIAADSGAVFLVHNEGNISHVATFPPTHIVITGVEKIMPTFLDALYQVLVQSAYAGLFPPTYLNVVSGPSSTADLEFHRVYGVHGPKEVHVILYDGGRLSALKEPMLKEQLRCIRCGRCQIVCPVWDLVGNIWGGRVYGGPMGIGWTAITEGREAAIPLSWFCLLCNACVEACPVRIDIPGIARFLRSKMTPSE